MQEFLLIITSLIIGSVATIFLIAILSANKREEEKIDAYKEGYQKGFDDGYDLKQIHLK